MVLGRIQDVLAALYDVEVDSHVDDFVCDAAMVCRAVGHDAPERGEVLLVVQDAEDVSVGLYVSPVALDALSTGPLDAWTAEGFFGAACLATEGVSHFLYVAFRATHSDSVTELELELQAEVDKYLSGLLAAPDSNPSFARSRDLRSRLFSRPEFIDEPHTERGRRYRTASALASRYARHLEERYVRVGNWPGLVREARQFYRRGQRGKVERAGECP